MNISLYNLTKDTQQFSVVMLSNALWSGASERERVEERISVAPRGALGLLVHVFYISLVMFVDNLTTQF